MLDRRALVTGTAASGMGALLARPARAQRFGQSQLFALAAPGGGWDRIKAVLQDLGVAA